HADTHQDRRIQGRHHPSFRADRATFNDTTAAPKLVTSASTPFLFVRTYKSTCLPSPVLPNARLCVLEFACDLGWLAARTTSIPSARVATVICRLILILRTLPTWCGSCPTYVHRLPVRDITSIIEM